jgi:hypothetical protein
MLFQLGAFGIKNNTISLVVDLVILFLVVMWLALVYWTYADDTVEEKIARVVAGRIQSMKEMIGDDTETLREIENLLRG